MFAQGKDIQIKANGITICYDDQGEGEIPVIFIHGFPFDKSSWQPQVDGLKENHRVISYDIRGFGKSEAGPEEMSMGLFADDLISLMDALQIKKAVVCGLSMGGYILLNAVIRYPQRFSAVILSDTQCIADSPEVKLKRFKTGQMIERGGKEDFATSFLKTVFCKESLSTKTDLLQKIKETILSTPEKSIIEALNALSHRHEMCGWLRKITVPTLILVGKEDAITPPVQSEFLLNKIPNAMLYYIDNAGHLSNLEQSEKFNTHLETFLSEKVKGSYKKTLIIT